MEESSAKRAAGGPADGRGPGGTLAPVLDSSEIQKLHQIDQISADEFRCLISRLFGRSVSPNTNMQDSRFDLK